MSDDSISRQAVIDLVEELETQRLKGDIGLLYAPMIKGVRALPSAQPHWIPVTERLPEERDWYLGIFEEPDTGWINPLPFICDYLLGKETKATTKEGWILKGYTDREEHIDYYFNLECVAWMLLPKPWKDMRGEQDE